MVGDRGRFLQVGGVFFYRLCIGIVILKDLVGYQLGVDDCVSVRVVCKGRAVLQGCALLVSFDRKPPSLGRDSNCY